MKAASVQCPSCGTALSRKGGSRGLCPSCLLAMALDDTSIEAEALVEPEAAPEHLRSGNTFEEGRILGGRYRFRSLLGRGGMGDVWRAYDLKLRQDVALKALRTELIQDRGALVALRKEVRTARGVISPNVCRVYDLEELDGQELVLMEYIDGTTLQEILKERSPLEIEEAQEIASQFLAGLEAIHDAGFVHRDIKPENVMVTRTGRVVVMDFGITKGLGDRRTGLVVGTPPYMSPEQARVAELDTRSDVFSAGVVLAEMVEPGGIKTFEDRQRVWEALHQEKPQVAETQWSRVIRRCVSAAPDERFASAAELARALEEVTLRAAGDDRARPYPGLSAFQEEDAAFFYGRELEVEALWKKLRRPHLMAVIGPSGAGKSSFLRAGLLPTLPDDWQAIIATPGTRPFANLARVLAPELDPIPGKVDQLLQFEDLDVAVELLSEWRQRCQHGLVVLDQFEELFTQNPPAVQERFAKLLGRLPLEIDAFVLLSMRDDFLFHCHAFEALAPVFAEMTPLGPPTGASLRRAIVQPALKCGYRFEDESTVEEMLHEVEGERGSLPMVAFATAKLWERRDRERGLLTHEVYELIGGVSGALAQHAETTLEQIGQGRIPIVRELFRNLVTAQGTRAARDREELLSVFEREKSAGSPGPTTQDPGPRGGAAEVLNSLIDARLLTSYELPETSDDGTAQHRIEIVHESLLSAWPRLVRWQTQDAEGAQLRDELRSQAQLWEQHARADDYLWTGLAFREYQLWRERYPGGLTSIEEEFTRAMTALAERRKRKRRLAVATVVFLALAVAAVTGVLWLRSEAQARRAEAAKLLAIAQLQLEADPTEALAYTTASLELTDTKEARTFAMDALWAGPPAMVLDPDQGENLFVPTFSPDGQWLSFAGAAREEVLVWHRDGGEAIVLDRHPTGPNPIRTAWSSDSQLATGHLTDRRVRIWSFPGGELVRQIDLGEGDLYLWYAGESHLRAQIIETDADSGHEIIHLRSWRLPDGKADELGRVDWTVLGASVSWIDFDGRGWAYAKGNEIFYRPLPVREGVPDRLVGRHENEVTSAYWPGFPEESDRLWTRDAATSELRLWSFSSGSTEPLRVVPRPVEIEGGTRLRPALGGRWLLDDQQLREGKALLWDLASIPGAKPRELRRSGQWYLSKLDLHPGGDWIVASTDSNSKLTFWPLRVSLPAVMTGYETFARRPVVFTPDSRWFATYWGQDKLRLWPLPGSRSREIRDLDIPSHSTHTGLAIDQAGERLLVTGKGTGLFVVPLDGGELQPLEGFLQSTMLERGAFSPSGRFAAAATLVSNEEWKLRVWDLETGDIRVFDAPRPPRGSEGDDEEKGSGYGAYSINDLTFVDETTFFTGGPTGVLRWKLEDGTWERFRTGKTGQWGLFRLSGDRKQMITLVRSREGDCGPFVIHDLESGSSRELETFLDCGFSALEFDPTLSILVAGQTDGAILVGRLDSQEAHLMSGHEGPIEALAISPDSNWIVSTGQDKTIRLWQMPNLDKPPLHTLPHDELIAKLESLTNLRAVRDQASSTGWSIEIGPFPGWKEVPEW